uniref:Uncharacterized protein n=1 Tax=Candidatus Kentrum sp. DK TaxID=2126562 RepID=A0A450TA38_9GAMM|nr:MAG: hypothetical protein BECKDK2373B_GA0170837_11275 [Candidatus Kentron sp. DK]
MIIADTGFWVALFNASDHDHEPCKSFLSFPSSSLGMQSWKLQLPSDGSSGMRWEAGASKKGVPKPSLGTSVVGWAKERSDVPIKRAHQRIHV